jgi:hypothetical protein
MKNDKMICDLYQPEKVILQNNKYSHVPALFPRPIRLKAPTEHRELNCPSILS